MCRFSSLILAILALLAPLATAVPASAQSARDFSLPPSQPDEEPEVQGPVDDSGFVPIGPRIIADDKTSEPVQAESPTADEPAADASATQVGEEPATPVTRPEPIISAPPATIRPQPSLAAVPPPADQGGTIAEPESGPQQPTNTPDPITFPPSVPSEDSSIAEPAEDSSYPAWLWIAAGGIILSLATLLGVFFWRRSKEQYVPQIERPIVAAKGEQTTPEVGDIRVDLDVELTGLTRSLMNLMLTCRISTTNRSDRALRELDVRADITSAHRSLPVEQQLAMPDTQLPLCAKIERIGPYQSHHEKLNLQIPVSSLIAFKQGEAALCVPLLRLRVEAKSVETKTRTFAIGNFDGVAARLQPIPLHVPPGSYPAATARALD